jgi:glycosyltransferase involved in cell wall biosynthesis
MEEASSSKRFHVLLVPHSYPRYDGSGPRFVREQSEALARNGCKVGELLFAFFSLRSLPAFWKKRTKLQNVEESKLLDTIRFAFFNPIPSAGAKPLIRLQKRLVLFFLFNRMRRYIRANGKPDLIHLHVVNSNSFIVPALSERFDIPYVLTEHYSAFSTSKGRIFQPFMNFDEARSLVAKAWERIAVSKRFASFYSEYFGSPYICINNLIPVSFEEPPLSSEHFEKTPFTFICIGALRDDKKRQSLLLRAFKKVLERKGEEIRLKLVGQGKDETMLKKKAEEFEVSERVEFTGQLRRKELIGQLDRSHVTVVSSIKETFGLTPVEGFFRGLPAVSTRCGGPEETINEEVGVFCEPEDVEDLASKMEWMVEHCDSFSPEKIRSYAHEHFSEARIVGELKKVYERCTSSSSKEQVEG